MIQIYADGGRFIGAIEVYAFIARGYFDGGLPAVEKALLDMMEAK